MLKSFDNYRHFAVLLVRAALGAIFIAHGGQKLFGWWGGPGIQGTIGFVGHFGLPFPTVLGWALMLAEFGGGIALVLGIMTRLFALGIAVDMAVAIVKVHWTQGFFLGATDGTGHPHAIGLEYPLFLLIVALSFFLGGAGRYSIDGGFAVERK